MKDITQEKADIRQSVRASLKDQDETTRAEKSARIKDLVLESPSLVSVKTVMLYWPTPTEVDTRELVAEYLKRGRTVCLPRIENNEIVPARIDNVDSLQPGSYGIPEPPQTAAVIPPDQIEVVFVPGLAFDRSRNRLGRGLGFYDRFLPRLSKAVKVGIAFDFQILPEVPAVPGRDVRMNLIISG